MTSTDQKNIALSKASLRSPYKFFGVSLLLGLLLNIFLLYLWSSLAGHFYVPHVDLDWLLSAAAVFATIAVATALVDLPIDLPTNTTKSHGSNYQFDREAELYSEKQLTLGAVILSAITVLATTCAMMPVFFAVGRYLSCTSCAANPRAFPLIAVASAAHFIIALLGSMGYRYKYQAFLRRRNQERIEQQYELTMWCKSWGLTPSESQHPTPKNDKDTFLCHAMAVLLSICILTVLSLLFTLFINQDFHLRIVYFAIIFSFVLGLSYYVSFSGLPECENVRRMAKTTAHYSTPGQKMNIIFTTLVSALLTLVQFFVVLLYFENTILKPAAKNPVKIISTTALNSYGSDIFVLSLCISMIATYIFLYLYTWLNLLPKFKFNQQYKNPKNILASYIRGMLLVTIMKDREQKLKSLSAR